MQIGVLIVLILILLIAIGSYLLKWLVNPVTHGTKLKLTEEAQKLHTELLIADMHADSLLYNNSLLRKSRQGHVDIPRLVEGNVCLQVFTSVTKFPLSGDIESNGGKGDLLIPLIILQSWPLRTWRSLTERALYHANKLHEIVRKTNGQARIIYSQNDLEHFIKLRLEEPKLVGAILGLEGGHCLGGKLENLNLLYDAGYRLMSPTHFFDNELGGSLHSSKKGGLSPFGCNVIEKMEELNMIIDLAHASPKMMDDVLKMVNCPVLVSHTGVKGICDNNRNLSDEYIYKIAENGGVIGIGFWDTATGGGGILSIARSIRYVSDLIGVKHVGLGSDFDGCVKTPLDASEMSQLTEALLQQGFEPKDIHLIMGGNFMRLLKQNLPSK